MAGYLENLVNVASDEIGDRYRDATTGSGGIVSEVGLSPGNPLGMVALYNQINGLLNPPKPKLVSPTSAAPVNPAAAAQAALTSTLNEERQQAQSYSYLPFTTSLDSGNVGGPNTTSRVLLGS